MIPILFAAGAERWDAWRDPLERSFREVGVTADLSQDHAPDAVRYIVYAPGSEVQDFRPFTELRAVLNIWAGVEHITDNETLAVPLTRMVDPGLTEGMVEYVTGHVLRHHLGMDPYITGALGWEPRVPPLARNRSVTVLGLGALGGACAQALAALNFRVTGWSRRPKELPGIRCLHGEEGLTEALSAAEILVLLLPRTPETEELMNVERLAVLPDGAVLINPGRGALIEDAALLAALDSGHVGHATLDVFHTEPLPAEHPFWSHPSVTVTPHIASETRPETAAPVIAENIRRAEAGLPLLHVVDRQAGY
ncbi:2-hydroxyacid dehydrogenase [Palleronia caenipelagi]|uniref:Glyoxylate/hydroxypyruvate reductase A n=1 Tax=Palleronia caenipelagi TaxID=2489174 RepID=A0A547QAS0_9RHOB|nr:glyoxylate/hydroxypyruvate reductase A [Palleronia caenipelagi]TRD23479.1 glyoxylate/hydroxypyruvate reductase A [Palleronia caenipelagi]